MKLALGDYMNIASSFDSLCLTDTSYGYIVKEYPHVVQLATKYMESYGKRVLNVSMEGAKPQIIYTPFDTPEITCNQLVELADKKSFNNVLVPMPKDFEKIRPILESLLDDRFIVVADDAKYLGLSQDSVIDYDADYPDTETKSYSNQQPTQSVAVTSKVINTSGAPTLCFTGHRPKDLYGYKDDKRYTELQNKIYACCEQFYTQFGVRRFISGCAQGVDMLSFFVVDYMKTAHPDISNDIFIPFTGHGDNLYPTGMFNSKDYASMLQKATTSRINYPNVSSNSPKGDIINALLDRNIAMLNESEYVLGVYSGDPQNIVGENNYKGGTLHCLKNAYKLGKKIVVINPIDLSSKKFNF